MKKSHFTEEQIAHVQIAHVQIAHVLRQAEAGVPVAELIRKTGITEQTFYRWKKRFGGMGVVELRRMRQVEEENRKLKQLVADLTLDKAMLQEV
jgi:putative transposase